MSLSNSSRRGFLISLLGCAVTGTLLSSTDLLAAAPVEDRYTEVVRLARAIVADDFESTAFGQMPDLMRQLGGSPERAAPQSALLLEKLLAIVPEPELVISHDEFELLREHQPDPEWGLLDERVLNLMVDRLVPFAVLSEVIARAFEHDDFCMPAIAHLDHFNTFNHRVKVELHCSTRPVPAFNVMLFRMSLPGTQI